MRRKNKLILHIGTQKTGTSSLQTFLTKNRKILDKYGWSYPEFRYSGGVVTRNLDLFLGDTAVRYLEELKNILNDKHVILSSEAGWQDIYWGWKCGKQMIKTLSELHDNIKAVVYLRRQDFYIEALWGEWVKYGATDLTLEEFESEMESQCDYNQRLDELAEIIGTDNIVVRPYEEEGFDTIHDFMKYLDLENCYLACGEVRERVNERTDIECLKLARICNCVRTREQSVGMGLAMRKVFSEIAGSKKEENPHSRGKYFSPAERKRILSKWEMQNRALAEKYLDRVQLFSNERTEYPFYNPPVSSIEETIVKMFMLLEVRKQNAMRFFWRNREKKIAFWGAGTRCGEIMRNGLVPDIIIDNDRSLRGEQLLGIPVVAVDDLDDLENYCIVITIQHPQEVCEQCQILGLTEGKEFICGGDMF